MGTCRKPAQRRPVHAIETVSVGLCIWIQPCLCLDSPILWGLLWNGFGAAIILPIYCLLHFQSQQSKRDNAVPLHEAKALVPTTLVGSLLPLILMLPPLVDCKVETQQAFSAVFQLTPVIFVAIQYIGARCIALCTEDRHELDVERPMVYLALISTGICSAIAHVYSLATSLFSQDPATAFSRVYIPSPARVDPSTPNTLTEGGLLFLQYDFLIISLTCILYAYLLLEPQSRTILSFVLAGYERPGLEKFAVMVMVVLTTVVLGPGAAVSFAFAVREDSLPKGSLALKKR